MSEMIERVARALRIVGVFDPRVGEHFARVAIEAMREPTPKMVEAAVHHKYMSDIEERWKVMIDAALAEEKK
jgi:hypothetical protein